MPKVTVPGHGSFEVQEGTKLVLALEDNGVNILHRCGGNARCTTCRVEVAEGDFGDLTPIEQQAFAAKGVTDELRLSCQVRVTGDVTVTPIMTVEKNNMDAGPRPSE
ncbi:2Fe-2S iron-sulfur cluster-binding protein [Bacillus alkalicellulosilyticus]|uniref:2Fe-2S iron-sulfur cluster-binding protein n=1 Tax=Alkalihalobacterium alkalicellulosilyticum TaxID=1912214 RepID=UPI0009966725|nr:2Fe-2S iron-sulfur cluster-binding protein [Bacillus alkalicellulosilyticus]